MPTETCLFKAAGTSFEGRPKILTELAAGSPWRHIICYHTEYEGEPAISLWDKDTGKQLGWVPKSLVGTFQNYKEMAGEIADLLASFVISGIVEPGEAKVILDEEKNKEMA